MFLKKLGRFMSYTLQPEMSILLKNTVFVPGDIEHRT
jgi:hypothetical protein